MRALRARLRLLRILVATLGWFALWCLGGLATLPAPRARRRVRGFAFGRWGAGLLGSARIELRVVGAPPRPPFLLVTNHSSYLDVPVLAAVADGAFVAKAEIARWPLVGFLARGMGTIFLPAGAGRGLLRAGEAIAARLRRGQGLFLFAEGGIPPGPELGPFRGSLLEPAARAGLPVHSAAIHYAMPPDGPPAERAIEWRRGEPLASHFLALLERPGARATVVFGAEAVRMEDRKLLAAELRRRVAALRERAEREPVPPSA